MSACAVGQKPLGQPGDTTFFYSPLQLAGNGLKLLTALPLHDDHNNPAHAGQWLSVQPDGTWQTRDGQGTWETFVISGSTLVASPVPDKVFMFAFAPALPNS